MKNPVAGNIDDGQSPPLPKFGQKLGNIALSITLNRRKPHFRL